MDSHTTIDLTKDPRVPAATRAVLAERADPSLAAPAPRFLDHAQYGLLCVVVDRLVPQPASGPRAVIAAEIDRRRTEGAGNGWRYAELPPDGEALQKGLAHLDAEARRRNGAAFADLPVDRQDALLDDVRAGRVDWAGLPADLWFEELLAECVELFVAHPVGLETIQFEDAAFLPRLEKIGLNAPALNPTSEGTR